MSKILIISENDSIWTRQCIENSNILGENEIYVLCPEVSRNDSFFLANGIHICRVEKRAIFNKIPKIRGLMFRLEYLKTISSLQKEIGHFDVVHISCVRKEKMMAIKYLRKFSKRIICTFWGSDLFRKSEKELLKYRKGLRSTDIIMLSTIEMRNRFIFVFGEEFQEKIRIIKFGVYGLKYIDPNLTSNSEAKKAYAIPAYKTVVTIGYNGSPAQNHLKVIDTLAKLPETVKSKLYIQLPLTYALSSDYRKMLTEHLDLLGCEYGFVESFLNDSEVGKLRESSDVFIHAQNTDASSASIQEYLFARKVVFNPSWIKYQDFKDHGVFFIEYNNFEQLGNMLYHYLSEGLSQSEKKRVSMNSDIIWKLSSWESVSEEWGKLYYIENE